MCQQSITKSRLGISITVSWKDQHWDEHDFVEISKQLDIWMGTVLKKLPKQKNDLNIQRLPDPKEDYLG